jgi:hypothetical protein
MYQDDAATWTQDGDWRKFTKRGFMLRRAAYEAVGGLEHRYLRFAETAIAARLHAHGYRLGYAPEAVVTHYNSKDLSELLDYVWEYRQQECAFAEEHPGLIAGQGLPGWGGAALNLLPNSSLPRTALRSAAHTFRAALRRFGTRPGRALAWTMLCVGCRSWFARHFGWSWQRFKARLGYRMARLRLACAVKGNDARQHAFMQVWQRLGDYAVVEYLHDRWASRNSERLGRPEPVAGTCRPGELSPAHLVGFHAQERWNGLPFRWTAPLACLAVDLAKGSWAVTLDTQGLRSPGFDEVRIFWNGVAAAPDPSRSGNGRLTFRVEPPLFVEPGPQLLTLTCSRLKGCGKGERRALGLPLFAVEFRAASGGALPVAA